MKNWCLRKNDNKELDKLFYLESFKLEGYQTFLKQLISLNNLEEEISEDAFFEVLIEYIYSYYRYKLLTKELVKNLSENLYEILLDKVYVPYRGYMLFNKELNLKIIDVYDFNYQNINYDYYEFLSYLLEGTKFIYCHLKRNNYFNNICKYLENYFDDKRDIDMKLKKEYNLSNNHIINFVNNTIIEVSNER